MTLNGRTIPLTHHVRMNRLSRARMFLFGARDVWFVVGIPMYFQAVLSDGPAGGRREAFVLIAGVMTVWINLYIAIRAMAPRLLGAFAYSQTGLAKAAAHGAALRVPLPFVLAALTLFAAPHLP